MSTPRAAVLSRGLERQVLHQHAEARLIVFTAGALNEETFDGVEVFCAGDVLFRPAYFTHANMTSEVGAAYLHIELGAAPARAWFRKHGWRAGLARRPFTSKQLLRLLHGRHFGETLLDTVCVRPNGPPAADQHHLNVAQTVPIAEAARRCGLKPYEMSRTFRRHHGCTPRSYRNLARLHRATRMLYEGELSLSEIAHECEYFDQSHFNRSVRREFGLTPAALARVVRN